MSPSELERLQDLLERVPEYRTELRQILELRSIIHDDALRLVPPRELSDRTRERVGAQFAGIESLLRNDASRLATPGDLSDATRMTVGELFASAAATAASGTSSTEPVVATVGTDEEPRERRRAIIIPYRTMGRALLAASIAITIALAPTLLGPSDDDPRVATSGEVTPLAAADPAARTPVTDGTGAPVGSTSAREAAVGIGAPSAPASSAARTAGARSSRASTVENATESSATESSATDVSASLAAVDSATASGASGAALASVTESAPTLDPDNPISSILRTPSSFDGGTYNPSLDTSLRARVEPVPELALATFAVPGLGDDGRLLSVGVTLGSGNVMDADAPTPLMQNSYYFSFSVSGTDRIGIEMGGSTFLKQTQVPSPRPVGDIFAKQGAGGDSSNISPTLRNADVTPTVARRMQQDITYGGVFYDRRLEIEKAWDVCGRVTFGAADGALVAGIRAYTAYSPTKNVTFTLGIGGSTLFDMKGRADDGSTNYGLYYGIETGF